MWKRILWSGVALAAGGTWASGLGSLEDFLRSTRSGQADFTQVVTSPPKAGQPARVRTSNGRFEFVRPNRFRFDYAKPFVQNIVADGQMLWWYDPDLNQVTVRSQAQTLGSTPAALIATAPDLKALQRDFDLSEAPPQDGLNWVVAKPKTAEGQLQSVRLGFAGDAAASVQLRVLDILDSFGQRSVITFSGFQGNVTPPEGRFAFKPPAGADVVRP